MQRLTPQAELASRGLQAKKSWGQNFLRSESILKTIAEAALPPSGYVLEIGAGLGHLSSALLAQGAKLSLLEKDRDMLTALRDLFGENENVALIEANATTFDYQAFAEGFAEKPSIAGNLPYHLTSPIVFRLLEVLPLFSHVVIMMQKEVGDRMRAAPDSKVYGALSVLVQARARVEKVCAVPRTAFFPVPNVDSVVLRLEALEGVSHEAWDGPFRRVVNAAFHGRRKTLRNTLRSLAAECQRDLDVLEEESKISLGRRAETLSIEEFWVLSRQLS